MANQTLVDCHVHLWDPNHFRIPWLDGISLNKAFLPADLHAQAAPHTIQAYVYAEVDVAPHYSLSEVRWVEAQAQHDPRLKGIIANAPLEYGQQVKAYLDELMTASPRVKGIRRLLQGEPDTNFCLRPAFVTGVSLLADYGLSFDICIRHGQLPSVIELVRRCPAVKFVLDHIAKPDIAHHVMEPWRTQLQALAALPNVACKISGMVNEADNANWRLEDLRPYVDHVAACFGEDRIMFGGDWPVCTLATTYARWVDTLDELTSGWSASARRKLFIENSTRIYRL